MTETKHCCTAMDQAVVQPDVAVSYLSKFREYGLDVADGGTSFIQLNFCPWCGIQYPASLRDEWFEKLVKLEVDPYEDIIPAEFCDDRWYS